MNMTLRLTTTYHLEGKLYVAYCSELGVTSQGKTLEEAEKNLKEAIELYLEDAPQDEITRYVEHPLIRTLDFNLA
jgi:predicted RNase H-like HicB family nuclease